jgi:hypothetical protein
VVVCSHSYCEYLCLRNVKKYLGLGSYGGGMPLGGGFGMGGGFPSGGFTGGECFSHIETIKTFS